MQQQFTAKRYALEGTCCSLFLAFQALIFLLKPAVPSGNKLTVSKIDGCAPCSGFLCTGPHVLSYPQWFALMSMLRNRISLNGHYGWTLKSLRANGYVLKNSATV